MTILHLQCNITIDACIISKISFLKLNILKRIKNIYDILHMIVYLYIMHNPSFIWKVFLTYYIELRIEPRNEKTGQCLHCFVYELKLGSELLNATRRKPEYNEKPKTFRKYHKGWYPNSFCRKYHKRWYRVHLAVNITKDGIECILP
jgi:hypothetical protein